MSVSGRLGCAVVG